MFNVIMAVDSEEIVEIVSTMPNIGRVEIVDSIEVIEEILEYETYDYIIVNTLLSSRKTAKLADYVENGLDSHVKPKIIALIKDFSDKKVIAQLVGLGVNAFVQLHEISLVGRYMDNYPSNFDLSSIADVGVKNSDITATRIINGTISIGVFNLENGAGATTCSLKLAEEIANCGYHVICLEIDQANFKHVKNKKKNLELISTTTADKDAILQVAFGDNKYQFIVIDFGRIIEGDDTGAITSINNNCIGDFLRCNFKIGMCFASAWHNSKVSIFLKSDLFQADLFSGELFVITSGNEKSEREMKEDYHELPIWSRSDIQDFLNHFKGRIGVSNIGRRKEKRRGFFRMKG